MISLLVSKSYNEQPFVKISNFTRMFGIWRIVCNNLRLGVVKIALDEIICGTFE